MRCYRILPEKDALALADALAGWKQGNARTRELTGTVKQNQEILDFPDAEEIGRRILNHAEVQLDHMPLKCHNPKASR